MQPFTLPPSLGSKSAPAIPTNRQITLIGANGAGKTLFMKELIKRAGDKAYVLSALSASFPERTLSEMPGSIDDLYARAVEVNPYLRADAVSELDKLCYLLFADEFRTLLGAKAEAAGNKGGIKTPRTRLDRLAELWERIFPGNHLLRRAGRWVFTTDAGTDPVHALSLSQGEKAVLYYVAAVLYAMPDAVVFIDSPTLFMHPSILNNLWNSIESLRPDCTFVYNTVDVDFVNTRSDNALIWVKGYDAGRHAWEYEVIAAGSPMRDDLFVDLMGSRRPVLFVEGDSTHSIDIMLYTLVFPERNVRPLGSCNKVIETTRTFSDQRGLHHVAAAGIVDRDRRTPEEVSYLRKKEIMVPEVAEVENLFLLEEVVRTMSLIRGKNPDVVFGKVRRAVLELFQRHSEAQALQHVRHRMKRDVEKRIDARFTCITALEAHIRSLANKLRPRDHYNELLRQFKALCDQGDYNGVLRVFNHKPMLGESHVADLLGYSSVERYIAGTLGAMKRDDVHARRLRAAVRGAVEICE